MTLYSQYISGNQVWAGTIVGSSDGISDMNPIVDRINSIAESDNLIIADTISGTDTVIYAGSLVNGCFVVEQRTTTPGDNIQGRFWIEI